VALPFAALLVASASRRRRRRFLVESSGGFAPIAPLVEAAIARHELPGAVVVVGRGDGIVYHQAFGQRALRPSPEAMTEATIFDLAR
jgi:hypothetical protein